MINLSTLAPTGNPNINLNQNTGQLHNPSPTKDFVNDIIAFLQCLLLSQIYQIQSDLDCSFLYDPSKSLLCKASTNLHQSLIFVSSAVQVNNQVLNPPTSIVCQSNSPPFYATNNSCLTQTNVLLSKLSKIIESVVTLNTNTKKEEPTTKG